MILVVSPLVRSRRNIPGPVSPTTRLVAPVEKASTTWPAGVMAKSAAPDVPPSASAPVDETLARVMVSDDPVEDKEVRLTVRVSSDEICRIRAKRHIATVGSDGYSVVTRNVVRDLAIHGLADQLGCAKRPVPEVQVSVTSRAWRQRGIRREHDVASIWGHCQKSATDWREGVAAVRRDADQLVGICQRVAHEDVQ